MSQWPSLAALRGNMLRDEHLTPFVSPDPTLPTFPNYYPRTTTALSKLHISQSQPDKPPEHQVPNKDSQHFMGRSG